MNRIVIWIILSFVSTVSSFAHSKLRINTDKRNSIRLTHVVELLGVEFGKKIPRLTHQKVTLSIYKIIQDYLPKNKKNMAKEITQAVLKQSLKYQLDPMFLTAVIYNESSFDPHAKGGSGEIGLMQILPSTGKWMAKKLNIKWRGPQELMNARTNVIIGASYLNYLRGRYNHAQLYLAAYNMGPRNLRKALRAKIRPRDYTVAVMKRYLELYKRL